MRFFNGSVWVDILPKTSADMVDVDGIPLDTVLENLDTQISEHEIDVDLHKTVSEQGKLDNLAADADATYATKSELSTHAGSTTLHKTSSDTNKLANMPDDANETFVTKEEFAGAQLAPEVVTDIDARDNMQNVKPGQQVWVQDPTDDNENISAPGAALYLYGSDEEWHFIVQMSGQITINWDEIEGLPTATPEQIDAAVAKAHEHSNKAVLDDLSDGGSDGLKYKGAIVGSLDNRIFLQDTAPATPRSGDLWFAPLEDD